MLFNSPEFIVGFLPIAVLGFFLLARWRGGALPIAWLVGASLFFYGWWDYRNLFVIVPSIVVNYLIGWASGAARARGQKRRARLLVVLGITADLAAIGYFKYAGFFGASLAGLTGLDLVLRGIVLPLGISFFTFQQIKFLVDRYTGVAPLPPLLDYALLVSFFPHVIAGPIVNHDELLPQFRARRFFAFDLDLFADGIAFFLLGLAKKWSSPISSASMPTRVSRPSRRDTRSASSPPGPARSPTRCSSISISPATPTWRSGSR
jgi:alginate O-acetyltransferase complex protein AlgI